MFADDCAEWYKQYAFKTYLAYFPSVIIVVINNVVAPLLVLAAELFGHLAHDQVQNTKFLLLFFQWTFSIGFVLIYYTQDPGSKATLWEPNWYFTTGPVLAFTFFQMFVPYYAFKILAYLGVMLWRLFDRGGSPTVFTMKTVTSDKSEIEFDGVLTRQTT